MLHKIRHILVFLSIALLFSGCQRKEDANISETQFWNSWPRINYGIMQSERLEVQPWYSGRCEATSGYTMAETKDGYYLMQQDCLYYADKADLTTWLPVCNKPTCSHSYTETSCNAHISCFLIKDGRIYFPGLVTSYPQLNPTNRSGYAIYSRALDGSDVKLEYYNEDLLASVHGGGEGYAIFTAEHFVNYNVRLNGDGTYTLLCHRLTENGIEELVNETVEDFTPNTMDSLKRDLSVLYGEPSFDHYYFGDVPYSECRYKDGQPYYTDLSDYYEEGRYLWEDSVRLFRNGDGYYDTNLNTKEEVRIGDAATENGYSIMLLPNCCIESTLFYPTHNSLEQGQTHDMAFFDGETWRQVQLPMELQTPKKWKYLRPIAVTSDSFFFICEESASLRLYRIPIQEGDLTLEYCGRIK